MRARGSGHKRGTPLNLVIGAPGLQMVRQKIQALTKGLDAWEKVTLGADFPDQR